MFMTGSPFCRPWKTSPRAGLTREGGIFNARQNRRSLPPVCGQGAKRARALLPGRRAAARGRKSAGRAEIPAAPLQYGGRVSVTAVSGLRYYLACAVAAGALAVLISWRLLPDPQLKDYALLIAEVGIGAAIALAVYGISRKNENKLREIAADARRLAQMQADAGRHMELAADRRLEAVLDEICKAADEVAKSKRSYDAGAKRHYSKEIRARCADLAKVAKELTDPPRSVYWAASLYKFRELYGICEKGPSFTDGGVDVSFCEVAKAKARERLEELRGRPGPTPGAQNGDGGRTGLISVSTDRAVYPPRSTIYARAGTSPSLRGKRIRYEIRDQAGAVVASLNLDPISWQDSDPARDGISEASFKMAGSSWAAGEYTVKAICGLSSAQDGFSVARHEPS